MRKKTNNVPRKGWDGPTMVMPRDVVKLRRLKDNMKAQSAIATFGVDG